MVTADEELKARGLRKRGDWSKAQWEAFQDGWGAARGVPAKTPAGDLAAYYEQGEREAREQ